MVVVIPTLKEERFLWNGGTHLIAGVDEVGRGPLAGPVMAAAVILREGTRAVWTREVRDSKQLTWEKREVLSRIIKRWALAVGVGMSSHEVIDTEGMTEAIRQAAEKAVRALKTEPEFMLVDGYPLKGFSLPQKGIIDGDQHSVSIAAASIVAKVTRDRLMVQYDSVYPGYGFAQHKGYSTREHIECLRRLGPCPIHRRSFAPVRLALEADGDVSET